MSRSQFSEVLPVPASEPEFPNLHKLSRDFGLCVVRRPAADENVMDYFLVVDGEGENAEKLSPIFASEAELEAYAADNMIDILHRYLGEEQPNSGSSFISF